MNQRSFDCGALALEIEVLIRGVRQREQYARQWSRNRSERLLHAVDHADDRATGIERGKVAPVRGPVIENFPRYPNETTQTAVSGIELNTDSDARRGIAAGATERLLVEIADPAMD